MATVSHSQHEARRWYGTTTVENTACAYVQAQLEFRWVDGVIYRNEWVTSTTRASSSNVGGVESPTSRHAVTAASDDRLGIISEN